MASMGIVVRRVVWLFDNGITLDYQLVQAISLGATYLVSCAFLTAVIEAYRHHRAQRRHIQLLSDNIERLERLLGEAPHG